MKNDKKNGSRSILQTLKERGCRLTNQRRILIETMQEGQHHLDAAHLLKLSAERDPRINRATVYRTLSLLKKLRLVDELDLMHLEGEKHFYEVRMDREHVHLACCCCGGITEFSIVTFDRLKREIAEQTGFEIEVARLEVGGKCPTCSAGSKLSASADRKAKG